MLYRLIAPAWLIEENPSARRVYEGEFDDEFLAQKNAEGYNAYYLPNSPSHYEPGKLVDGKDIDTFNYVFVDMDMKEGKWESKEAFISFVKNEKLPPTAIVDSGHGVHVYWAVTDLDALGYLRLQRRLCRKFNTDEAVGKIYQLLRVPGTLNTKNKDVQIPCELLHSEDIQYSSEQLDAFLPQITLDDETYCQQHYHKTYHSEDPTAKIDDKLPLKFAQLLRNNKEVRELWRGNTDDRSKADYRLGHIMFADGFTKKEALSTLVNSAKALQRAPAHRISYAESIIEKIWTFELEQNTEDLSMSVKDILSRRGDTLKGTRFPCHAWLDATEGGFRLGQVLGLVAGSGVGKTAVALNMFMGFVKNNPDYDHFFVPLEQPANEIAERWRTMCGVDAHLHDKVQIISNYGNNGEFRHLSLSEIKDYILKFQSEKGRKVGCVVIDHIGALKKQSKDGENQGLMDICHEMKAFAVQTNTLLVMQSQAPREKAGIGDLELNKDAAYGTVYFESYCDYLVSIWQPLKRCYGDPSCPTVTAFKYCKIRHKKQHLDIIQEDVPYILLFDPATEHLRTLTQEEEKSFDFWNKNAVNIRKKDRKTDIVSYTSVNWTKGDKDGATENNTDESGTRSA